MEVCVLNRYFDIWSKTYYSCILQIYFSPLDRHAHTYIIYKYMVVIFLLWLFMYVKHTSHFEQFHKDVH